MKDRTPFAVVAAIVGVLALLLLAPHDVLAQGVPGGGGSKGAKPAAIPGLALEPGTTVGAAGQFANLTIFPVYASLQEDIGEFTTLEAALEKKTAEVRELDEGESGPAASRHRRGGDGAQVGTLVIQNKGKVSILVLAGTVVKGGKQDRQIGQDFVVGAGKTIPVDAFCVEHGRWDATRDGAATGGKFGAMKTLANAQVRAAGQYEKNQSEVWSNVSKTNQANKKSAASGTLTATLDDPEIGKQRADLAGRLAGFLKAAPQESSVVGLAYAVDGKVRGVRWFMNHKLFEMHKDTLVNTAALEAITAQAEAKAASKPVATARAEPGSVVKFVTSVKDAAKTERRATKGENTNYYFDAKDGYGSSAEVKPSPAAKPKVITRDFLTK